MNTDEQAIRELIARWRRATAAGDVDAVLALMADDAVFLVPGQAPMVGRGAFERGLRTVLAQHRIESSSEVREIVVSGELAYCWTALTVRVAPLAGGNATVRAGNTLSILRKQASGAWVLTRDANLLAPASAS